MLEVLPLDVVLELLPVLVSDPLLDDESEPRLLEVIF